VAEAIRAHAIAELPNEACGIIVGTADPGAGGEALRYAPCRNEAASPVLYRVHPDDLYRLAVATDDAGEAFWGIVHSHVRSAAVPSRRDVEAASWPSTLYILVAVETHELRAWRIVDGAAHEIPLAVVAS